MSVERGPLLFIGCGVLAIHGGLRICSQSLVGDIRSLSASRHTAVSAWNIYGGSRTGEPQERTKYVRMLSPYLLTVEGDDAPRESEASTIFGCALYILAILSL
jgi:hypothetical protein